MHTMNDKSPDFQLSRASTVLGAEVSDIDLAASIDETLAKNLGQALCDHHLLIFRDQRLAPRDLARIGRVFGSLTRYPFLRALPGEPFVAPVIKEPWDAGVFGGGWHTDTPYLDAPAKATMLYALEVPESGGDTLFSNMHLAYCALPSALKRQISALRGVFTSQRVHSESGEFAGSAGRAEDRADASALNGAEAEHPLVRRHPETGALSLHVSPLHLCAIVGLSQEKGATIIEQLNAHAIKDAFRYRLAWRPRTLAIWDNRCLLHCPMDDYAGQRRVMHRVSIGSEGTATSASRSAPPNHARLERKQPWNPSGRA